MTNTPDDPTILAADVVEAGAFVLVDKQGKRRASLSCMSEEHCKDGYTTAMLFDGEGNPRITLQVNEEGANIQLWNRSNSPCLTLNVSDEQGTGIMVTDLAGKSRFQVGAGTNGASGDCTMQMEVVGPDGITTWPENDTA